MIQNFVKRLNNITWKNRFFTGFENFFKSQISAKKIVKVKLYDRQNFFWKKSIAQSTENCLICSNPRSCKINFLQHFWTYDISSPKFPGLREILIVENLKQNQENSVLLFSSFLCTKMMISPKVFDRFCWNFETVILPYCWLHMESTGIVVIQVSRPSSMSRLSNAGSHKLLALFTWLQ